MLKHPNFLFWLTAILVGASLACGGAKTAKVIQVKGALPTLTPTVVAVSQAAPAVEAAQPANKAQSAPPAQNTSASIVPASPTSPTATQANETQPLSIAPTASPTATPTSANVLASPVTSPTTVVLPVIPTTTATATTQPPQANPTATLPPPKTVPTPSIPPAVDGWTFVGVRTVIDYEDAVVVGELINNTQIPQRDVYVSGVFYDRNNQVILDEIESLSYVPVEIIPVGGRVPFELVVESAQPIYRLDLYARSEPSGDPPRQDFQFADVTHWTSKTNMYCLGGKVLNPSPLLEDYLVVLATIYNNQGYVASFGEYSALLPASAGNQSTPFELCIDPLEQPIVHYELKALGR